MNFIVLNCQVVEWVDVFANPVFKNQKPRNLINEKIGKKENDFLARNEIY